MGIKKEDSDLYSTANGSRPVDPAYKNASSTKITSRKRSNSNPPIPSPQSLQFKVEHVCPLISFLCVFKITNSVTRIQLFSAESPGVF